MNKIILPFGTEDGEVASTAAESVESGPLPIEQLREIFAEFAVDHKTTYYIIKTSSAGVEVIPISQLAGDQIWGSMKSLWKYVTLASSDESKGEDLLS